MPNSASNRMIAGSSTEPLSARLQPRSTRIDGNLIRLAAGSVHIKSDVSRISALEKPLSSTRLHWALQRSLLLKSGET